MLLTGAVMFILATVRVAFAQPLVDVDWIAANTSKPGVVVLDIQPVTDFLRGHIPGARNIDYWKDGWVKDRADKVPEMFPVDVAALVDHIGKLGVDNNAHVVIVTTGKSSPDVARGTRIYWTFKVLGHDNVSLLDGGMAAYAKEKKHPVEIGAAKPVEAKTFKASLRKDMIATAAEAQKAVTEKKPLADIRTSDLYLGITKSPKTAEAGTLPGAKNLPHDWLTVDAGGKLRGRAQLEQLFTQAGVPRSGDLIVFCNTGHLSSLGWFVSSELLGNKQTRMYSGSMAEWTILKSGPVEKKVQLQ